MPKQFDRQEEAMDLDTYRVFRSQFASKTVRLAWAKSYGDQFWEESDPPLSQATIDDIKFLTQRLRPGAETKLVDLGCGIGCVGRYLAKEFDADVEGIDANPLAIRMADELAVTSGMAKRLRFKTGDIAKTGWSDHSFDGALSMDVLIFVPDKRAALQEVARILKPGGRFVGTTWELRTDSAPLSSPAFDEYPSAFRDAGFTIEVYEETRNWRSLLTNALGALLASEDAVRKEVGGPRAEWLLAWARARPAELEHSRRVRFCVQRAL
jgi:2-polyprenyl-3-methyl-5-hydroxy-6-metoxy-1,4-benzoquinol methylase